MPALMFIASSDWDALVAKGVSGMMAERSEGGYFHRVVSLHPLARRSRTIPIAPGHDLVEFGFDAFPGGAQSRLLRICYAPLYVLRAALGVRALIRDAGIDIVRASDPYWAALVGWLGSLGTQARFCVSIHADWDKRHDLDPRDGAPKLFRSRRLAKLLERMLLRRALRVLCIRRSLFDYATASGARADRLRLIPHGVDLRMFRDPPPRPDVAPRDVRLVVFSGRLTRENYIDDVIAVARLLAQRQDVAVLVAGGGPEEGRLRALVEEDIALSRTVRLLGFVPRETAIALRFCADVNLVPMGGFSLIEACASGRPAVAYDVEWHREIIDERTGRLVPEGDVEALATAVEALLDDPALAEALGRAARARAFADHDLDAVQRRRAAVYAEILQEGSFR